MKTLIIVWMSLISVLLGAEGLEVDFSQYGDPVDVQSGPNGEEARPESELDREISEFRANHQARNAVLINNSEGRAFDEDGRVRGSEGLGRLAIPTEVILIAEARVARPVVELYTSIKKLPNCAHTGSPPKEWRGGAQISLGF
jgi:hypothetical protein